MRMKEARDRYMDIARLCKKELERFDIIKIRDFQQMCVTYIEEVMNMEQLVRTVHVRLWWWLQWPRTRTRTHAPTRCILSWPRVGAQPEHDAPSTPPVWC